VDASGTVTLDRLLPGAPAGVSVAGIAYDSRLVKPGDVFVAIRGFHVDGHAHIDGAIAAGAAAVVHQDEVADIRVPHKRVPDSRAALAHMAAEFHGHPSREILVVGVTGTDGKTTTCALVAGALRRCGYRPGVMTTVYSQTGGEAKPNLTRQTTLEAPEIQKALSDMLAAGCDSAVLEVTSHALALNRVDCVEFDVAAVTNVSPEHLDFHGDLETYMRVKASLIERAAKSREKGMAKSAVINAGDPSYALMHTVPVERRLPYGRLDNGLQRLVPTHGAATLGRERELVLVAEDVRLSPMGAAFRARLGEHVVPVEINLPGSFNVDNALCALGVAACLGGRLEDAALGLSEVGSVPGRMERVDAGQPYSVVIDYAHTPASLEKVLDELAPLTSGRVLLVVGAAGERDAGKRGPIGAIAARRCALSWFTDEDPRGEDAGAILEALARGATEAGGVQDQTFFVLRDRAQAIAAAISAAQPGDTVLLAGKGHERSIIQADGSHEWDERAAAVQALAAVGHGPVRMA
jgi:UDP-N-acetylmuramoyl-L-alanyl-D-glutamate--2,6-diaminopimelate ligase